MNKLNNFCKGYSITVDEYDASVDDNIVVNFQFLIVDNSPKNSLVHVNAPISLFVDNNQTASVTSSIPFTIVRAGSDERPVVNINNMISNQTNAAGYVSGYFFIVKNVKFSFTYS